MSSAGPIIGYSFGNALLLVVFIFAYNMFFLNNNRIVFWVVFLIFGFAMNFLFNSLAQLNSCENVNIEHVAKNSIWVPLWMLIFLGLSSIGILSNPVRSALPVSVQMKGDVEVNSYVNAYYMFWAGLFGQMLSTGFSMSCQ